MTAYSDIIERRAIDVSGRLGSFYDASHDCIVHRSAVTGFQNPQFGYHYDYTVLTGDRVISVIDLLKQLKFDDALLHSILLGTIHPSGISSFIDYNGPFNENTIFIYYLYKDREEKLDIKSRQIDGIVPVSFDSHHATHMITRIIWGFEFLCVIQNPTKESANKNHQLLYSIGDKLQHCDKPLELTEEEKRQLNQLSDVTIFGSKPSFVNSNTSLLTIFNDLRTWQQNKSYHYPIVYALCPLNQLCKTYSFPKLYRLSEQDNVHIAQIEPTIAHLYQCFNHLEHMFKDFPNNHPGDKMNGRIDDIPGKFCILLKTYQKFRAELQNILVQVRQGACRSIEINNVIKDRCYLSLRRPQIDVFNNEARQWLEKMKLIERFNADKIIYNNVMDILHLQNGYLTMQNIDNILKDYFSKKYSSSIVWYSSNRLKREKPTEWKQIYARLISQRRQLIAQQTSLIYVDFSQCSQKLEEFYTIKLPIQPPIQSPCNPSTVNSLTSVAQERVSSTSSPSVQQSSPSRTEINVLLLGETGVGKSTFINAFVNYLIFDTLQQAQQNQPVVLIPVSFLTTIGDQFNEVVVKFGEVDPNENFEHEGQSVTQQCKSYVFDLNDKLRLRLINTPGIGDTRGVDQDDKNIHHILTYANNLSHLNAICLLLKPNTSRLTVFFRSCINQLFTYLTPIGYSNIIFCFTNARATFYAPGDTGPLLRQMLKKEYQNDIPFGKTNTFCFENKSFRYLAARKCDIEFDEFQKQECMNSWITSVTESVRLLKYILTQEPYYVNGCQSPRKSAFDISMLARPLMETLRLILYNLLLREFGEVNKKMSLNSNPVAIKICCNCAQKNITQLGPIWMVEYGPTKSNSAEQCQCPSDNSNFLIEYTTKHSFTSQPIELSVDDVKIYANNLLFQCDRLMHFLRQKEIFIQHDPFQLVFERFLEEEQLIANSIKINLNINKRMNEILRSISQIRHENKQKLIESKEKLSVKDIYQIIDQLKQIGTVNQQIESIKTSRDIKMKKNEHPVELPSIKNKQFSEIIKSFHSLFIIEFHF